MVHPLQVLSEAIKALQREEEPNPEKLARVYSVLCTMASHNSSRVSEALRLCDLAVSTHNMSSAHNSRGALLLKLGRNTDAKLSFETAVKLDPQNINAIFNLALVYQNLGDTAKAIETLERVLSLDSNHPQAKQVIQGLKNNVGLNLQF